MGPAQAGASGIGNRLLAALPPAEQQQLVPLLTRVTLANGQRVLAPRDRVQHNYFPLDGVMCLLMVLEDGTPIEVATIGREGFVSIESLLSVDLSPYEVLCQTPVTALRLPVDLLQRLFRERPAVRDVLLRYAGVVLGSTGRSVGCATAHSIEQRLARWILMTRDRVETPTLPLTQELLSHMLGVRRATVSRAAEALRDQGLIRYQRGQMTILDRPGLEAATCEDYAVYTAEYARLLGPVAPPPAASDGGGAATGR